MALPRSRYIVLVVSVYVLLAFSGILLSERLLASLSAPSAQLWLATVKGSFFVLASAALFYLALKQTPDRPIPLASPPPAQTLHIDLTRRQPLVVYGFALLITACTLTLRILIGGDLDERPMMILFMLPIILSALLGGLGPGLLATILAAAGIDILSSPNFHSVAAGPQAQLQWLFLIVNGVAVSILSTLLHHSTHKLENHRRLMEAVFSGTSDAVFVKDKQGRYLLANQAVADFIGKPLAGILGKDDRELFDAESAAQLMQQDQKVMAEGKVLSYEEHLNFGNGQSGVFLATKGPTFDHSGHINGCFGISRDISGLKRAELEMRSNEAALNEAQRLARVGSWEWDCQTGQHRWSAQIYQIYGRNPALPPAVYPEVKSYFTDASWQRLSSCVGRCLHDGTPYTCDAEVVRPDGCKRWITARGEAVRDRTGQIVRLQGTVQDISEQQQIMLQAIASEERMQMVLNATSDGFWDWDLETGHIYRSRRYYEATGYLPEDDTHDLAFFKRMVHPDDLLRVQQIIDAHRQGKTPDIEFDCRIQTRTGESKWIRMRGGAVAWNKYHLPQRLMGTITDITERKRIGDDLQLILNETADAIWIASESGALRYANPAASLLTGLTPEQLRTMQVADLVDPAERPLLQRHLRQLQQQQLSRNEWTLCRGHDEQLSVELSAERLPDGRLMLIGRDLTAQKQAQVALRDREQQLARVLQGSDQGYWEWNLQTNHFQVSERGETMLGYTPGEMNVSPERWPEHVHPDDLHLVLASIERHLHGASPQHQVEFRARSKNGNWLWILTRGKVVEWDQDGKPLLMSGTHSDISERKQLEMAQKAAGVVFDSSYDGIMVVSPDVRITKVNAAFTRITGYSAAEVAGQSPKLLASGLHNEPFFQEMVASVTQHDYWRGEIWNKRKSGDIYPELLSISAVRDERGQLQHYIGIFSDISQIKAHEAELNRVANYDPLTGIPNRRLLSDRLQQAIIRASRSNKACAVCFLDLDGFKAINDQHGHSVGDRLLIHVTQKLQSVLRADDTLARLGGDEFALLLSDIGGPEECTLILDRVLSAVTQPFCLGDICIVASASIGVSLYPQDNADPDTLLRHADQAMYQAKQAGKNRYQLFDPESDRKAQTHRSHLQTLQQALRNGEFVLYYQPKVDLINGNIIGAEALIRWQHPLRGLVPPLEFLPYLSGSDLEMAFGEWVMHTAMDQAAQWHAAGMPLSVGVNVSANHLLQADFCDFLQSVLQRHPHIPPATLELEVLESAAIADMELAIQVLQRCRELGVRFALDDFGTGYSSLIYLRKLPIDTLKIDQSFVRNMLNDNDDLGIVESVIRLAAVFNRQVVAEGVETLAHGARLNQLGCRLAQGYGIARPMTADAFLPWCQKWQQEQSWQALQQPG